MYFIKMNYERNIYKVIVSVTYDYVALILYESVTKFLYPMI